MSTSHFDEIATEYDASLPAHVVEHYLDKRTAFVRARCAGRSVLDVGCGTGALAGRLQAAGYEVTGLDPSEGMLDVMRARTTGVVAVHGSGTELPFESGHFDIVLTVATLHHIADPADVRQTLAEMVRVCAPGGTILVWDHNPRNPYWSHLMARVPQDTGEERLIPEGEITSALRAAGAEIVSSEQLGLVPDFTPPRAVRAAAALERLVERTPAVKRLAAHNVVLARRARANADVDAD